MKLSIRLSNYLNTIFKYYVAEGFYFPDVPSIAEPLNPVKGFYFFPVLII